MEKGLVIKSTGSWYSILRANGGVVRGRLRGKMKLQGSKATNPVAVGDYVDFETETGNAEAVVIHAVHDRDNYIVRKSTHKTDNAHVLAANIDQALIVATISYPRTSTGFIDRFLVSAESFQIPAVVVFNKTDLLSKEEKILQEELAELYESLGYGVLALSALNDTDLQAIETVLLHKKTLIAGHSGVGKSTLLNRLIPGLAQKTSEISSFANKGVHTTTYAEMFKMAEDTFLIDTPGIKELGILDIEENEIGYYFPEMRALLNRCRYHNCTHTHEPGCVVLAQVEAGKIAVSRFHSYLSMLTNEDNRR